MAITHTKKNLNVSNDSLAFRLFENQVLKSPNQIALIYGNQAITYEELNHRANRIASLLIKYNIHPDTRIAIILERSIEMIVAILGILKAGAAYVPIDPYYPPERINFILQNCQAPLILSENNLINLLENELKKLKHQPIIIEIKKQSTFEVSDNLSSQPNSHDLAYVIYTSGSTGNPKGVMIEHRSVTNLLESMQLHLQLNETDLFLAVTSIAFDIAFLEILLPLTTGGTLLLAQQKDLLDIKYIKYYLDHYPITVMQATPSVWQMLLEAGWDNKNQIKILCGGEALTKNLAMKLLTKTKGFWNCYGPTETTIWSTLNYIEGVDKNTDFLSIGLPILNTQIYILNENLQIQVIHKIGELYIGGVGVARGYLNDSTLTHKHFIENPFNKDPQAAIYHKKLFKTGDLVKMQANGHLQFIGRQDDQVKIRGYRIELAEIEYCLMSYPNVKQAVVTAKKLVSHHFLSLTAYIIPNSKSSINIEPIRQHLKSKLPDYMIPSFFMLVDAFPLTPNGKINKKALPKPELSQHRIIVEPSNNFETLIHGCFAEVLNCNSELLSVDDNFFNIGGDSLLAMKLILTLQRKLKKELSMRTFFENPTVQSLSQVISILPTSNVAMIPIIPREKRYEPQPLSFAQQRLWFLNQLEPESSFYNSFIALKITGELDHHLLEKTFQTLVHKHESLRTCFILVDGQPKQQVLPTNLINFSILIEDVSGLTTNDIAQKAFNEANMPFQLFKAPNLRVRLLRHKQNIHYLFICLHHIIIDGWSLHLLFKELSELYQANSAKNTMTSPLFKNDVQYIDFSCWQREWLSDERLQPQLTYWVKKLKNLPQLQLPISIKYKRSEARPGKRIHFALTEYQQTELKKLASQINSTLFTALLSIFAALLARYTQKDDLAIGFPITGRHYQDVSTIIGFFVNILVLRINTKNASFLTLLHRNQEIVLDAFKHQDVPFEKLVKILHPFREKNTNPLCQILFVFQNYEHTPLKLNNLVIERVFSDNDSLLYADYATAKLDLTLYMQESDSGLQGLFEYNCNLFQDSIIKQMIQHFKLLIDQIILYPELPIYQLDYLTPDEKKFFSLSNQTSKYYPLKMVHQLFDEQTKKSPSAIAIIFNEKEITYQRLQHLSNKIANKLLSSKIEKEDRIIIFMERSIEMIASIIGIMKTGAAYIPIDPNYPIKRIQCLLEDCNPAFIITQKSKKNKLSSILQSKINSIEIESILQTTYSTELTQQHYDPYSLAYIMYTSGSTGIPKGVMIEHHSLSNLFYAIHDEFKLTEKDTFLAITSISFDISCIEIFYPLIKGGTLILTDEIATKDGNFIKKLLNKYPITIMQATPATWQMLLHANWKNESKIKIITTGETIAPYLAHQLLKISNGFWNCYGPTETTIWSTIQYITQINENQVSISIGKPIANHQVFILDKNFMFCPIGLPGEMYIAGQGLARGYLNKNVITQEKFLKLSNPLLKNIRLYKTGDIAYWDKDQNLIYCGRNDDQIKIRGLRIELNEIINRLLSHPNVEEAAVIKEEIENDNQLIAYVTLNNNFDILSEQILFDEHLKYWQQIYNQIFSNLSNYLSINFTGWVSSYTKEPLPVEDMYDWLHSTIDRIIALKPKEILEIGCGTGLLLFQLLPYCNSYTATDLSNTAILSIQNRLQKKFNKQINLIHRAAHIFTPLEKNKYDTIILNSVIQYFPDISYLIKTLEGALETIKNEGQIFIGDIRSFEHLELFHSNVQFYQTKNEITYEQWKEKVKYHFENEEELAVSQNFFYQFAQSHPRISYVTIQLKKCHYINEITEFRYDVILHVNKERIPITPEIWHDYTNNQMKIEEIKNFLLENKPSVFGIKNIPNSRLKKIALIYHDVIQPRQSFLKSKSIQKILASNQIAFDPNQFWDIEKILLYDVEVHWASSNIIDAVDVIFRHRLKGYFHKKTSFKEEASINFSNLSPLALTNKPVQRRINEHQISILKNYLQQFLPRYMIPSKIIILNHMPLTPNGKIDKQALPRSNFINFQNNIMLPKNKIEQELHKIWCELLNINSISTEINFFDVGGHSLLAMQLIGKINKLFNITFNVKTLFTSPSISELASVIGEQIIQNSSNISLNPIVHINDSNEKPFLFLIHPIGGSIISYKTLIEAFPIHRAIYALQDPSLLAEKCLFSDIEGVASYYVKHIKELQSEGPYYLGGYSMGGIIAAEMAMQLVTQGEKIQWLGLIDSWAFSANNVELLDYYKEWSKQQYVSLKEKLEMYSEQDLFILQLYLHHIQILSRYQIPSLPIPLTLFKAEYSAALDEPSNYWNLFSQIPVKIHLIPGNHETIFKPPHIKYLAEKLIESLKD